MLFDLDYLLGLEVDDVLPEPYWTPSADNASGGWVPTDSYARLPLRDLSLAIWLQGWHQLGRAIHEDHLRFRRHFAELGQQLALVGATMILVEREERQYLHQQRVRNRGHVWLHMTCGRCGEYYASWLNSRFMLPCRVRAEHDA